MNNKNKIKLIKIINEIDGLTDNERNYLLELLYENKTYGLIWENKLETIEEHLHNELPILTEVPERAIISDYKDAPNHSIIEGDNLAALIALTNTHKGKIDVIYIDPPYNTGNKNFIYNDFIYNKKDKYKHSSWLSFMYKRLKLARNLLSDEGIIFISIDDNEQANLKLLCDNIFGENNFIGMYLWKRTNKPSCLSRKIKIKVEYIICYQNKNILNRTFSLGKNDSCDSPLLNGINKLDILEFPKKSVYFNLPDGVYSNKSKYKIQLLNNITIKDNKNINSFKAIGNFKWTQKTLNEEILKGTTFLIKSDLFSIRYKRKIQTDIIPSNIIDENVNVGTNDDARKEIKNIGIKFNHPKPVSLISYLIKISFNNRKNINILDFFAGSGTTLHATMKLNAEDEGHRQCILITNNENNICEKVTYERNKRIINGYTTFKGEYIKGLKNNNLRYYKIEFIKNNK